MDLEQINTEYTYIKEQLESSNKKAEELQNQVEALNLEKLVWTHRRNEAVLNVEPEKQKEAEQKIEEIGKLINDILVKADLEKSIIVDLDNKLKARINELMQNPELKEHLNDTLVKKYERKLEAVEKDKEKAEDEKEKLTQLKDLFTNNKQTTEWFVSYVDSVKEVQKLQDELDSLKDENGQYIDNDAEAKGIEIENKIKEESKNGLNNKNLIIAFASGKGIEINENDIDKLADYEFLVNYETNTISFAQIDKKVKQLNRQVKRYDKIIDNYSKALRYRGARGTEYNEPDNQAQAYAGVGDSMDTEPIRSQSAEGFVPIAEARRNNDTENEENKPKWWQFRKRFRNWNEKRKQLRLQSGEDEEITSEESTPVAEDNEHNINSSRNEFTDSLKYDVVKDIRTEMEKADIKKAKEERRLDNDDREPGE